MKTCWLLDGDMFGAYRDRLVASVRAQGHDVKLIHAPQPPYRWDDAGCSYRETFPKDACVIAHGDIELVTRIQAEQRWVPGAFGSVGNFYCSNYYCPFGEYILNADYIMLPFGELKRRLDFLIAKLSVADRLFVRPDSPLKLFTGQIVSRETIDADLEFMAFYEFPEWEIVVVSSPKSIETEWRFVVVNKSVVAGCQYKCGDRMDSQPSIEPRAFDLACQIAAKGYQPDPAWVMDICQTTDGSFRLLEIGGFSFADLYSCDTDAIVAAVSDAAVVRWEEARSS